VSGIARKLMSVAGRSGAWDISSATYNYNIFRFYVGDQETTPKGLFFKPDGTKVYVIGITGDDVNEYNLGTAWSLDTASFVQSFSVGAQENGPNGLFFKSDGTKMYIVGAAGDDVNEYDLSTAWDVSSASYLQNFSVSGQDTSPEDIFFKPDGTKMYIVGDAGNDVNEYTLSTAWNVTTASYVQNFSVGSQDLTPQGLFFKDDGTKMYVVGDSNNSVYEYDLGTAWNISTASYLQTFSVDDQDTIPEAISFKSDGTKMYVLGNAYRNVLEYSLGTAWNISTAVWSQPTGGYFNVTTQETQPQSLFFKPDGLKVYIVGIAGDDVNEYDLSIAWDVSSASYLQNFSVATEDTVPRALFFKPDGTKMYILGGVGDDVNEYNLSSAWDVTTASYVQNFSVTTQESNPRSIFFKDDGTKMYVTGNDGDEVNEYNLGTAWNISTASALQTFSVASQTANPSGLFFKDDGTKMYVSTYGEAAIYQYDLSTAWDISSASYVQSFSFLLQDTNPEDIFFKDDGTKLYMIGDTFNAIFEYDLQ